MGKFIMYNRENILIYLREHQTSHRFAHTLSAEQNAISLAQMYGVDEEKAKIAALLHDCAKWMDDNTILKNALEYGLALDNVYSNDVALVHGWAGANIAKNIFGIYDKEILDAICYHTIPSLVMSDLSKLIYIADYIEEYRDHDEARIIRESLNKGLNKVFLMVLKRVIIYQIKSEKPLHVDSVNTYNRLMLNK